MTDIPRPAPGDTDWIDWADDEEATSDLIHAATPLATAGTLVKRDSAGRFAAVDGSAASDVATKGQLDGKAAASHTHAVADLTATGTKDATTFLRGDNTWAVPAGGTSATAYRRVAIWNGTNYVVNAVVVTSGNRVATTFYSFLGGPDPNALGLMIDGDEWKDAT